MFAKQLDPDPLRIVSSGNLTQSVLARAVRKLVGDEALAGIKLAETATRAMYKQYRRAKDQAERRLTVLIEAGQKLDVGNLLGEDGEPNIRNPKLDKLKKDELKHELVAAWDMVEQMIKRMAATSDLVEMEILQTGQEESR